MSNESLSYDASWATQGLIKSFLRSVLRVDNFASTQFYFCQFFRVLAMFDLHHVYIRKCSNLDKKL